MNIRDIRKLLRDGHSVVLVEEGETPLVVTELKQSVPPTEEVPIASRWPKGLPDRQAGPPAQRQGRTIHDPGPSSQDPILERLNKEILALKAEIAQQGEAAENH